ncbi:MAG: hypothetical protein JWL97_3662 [Gemmatimonadales bacterium]|nr:hypothetical protein [Gemmatimonadales bacterium]
MDYDDQYYLLPLTVRLGKTLDQAGPRRSLELADWAFLHSGDALLGHFCRCPWRGGFGGEVDGVVWAGVPGPVCQS